MHGELDPNIRKLVRAINAFRGIETIGSCGGHADAQGGQWPEGTWYVTFSAARDDDGWFALEFLSWLINCDLSRAGYSVVLVPRARPPYANAPGEMLHFALEGCNGVDPDEVAGWINRGRRELYIAPADYTEEMRADVEALRRL